MIEVAAGVVAHDAERRAPRGHDREPAGRRPVLH
jgi:hypothetical protein